MRSLCAFAVGAVVLAVTHAGLAQDPPVASEASPLEPLAWVVGEWTDESGGDRVSVTCSWAKNQSFITREFKVAEEGLVLMQGTQVLGWDAAQQRFRSWTFDSEGGFGEAIWTQDGDRWLIKKTFTLATGERASALNVLTRVDDNTATWQSVNREVGGDMLPNTPEVTVIRAQSMASPDTNE